MLLRLVSSGNTRGIKARREDGVVRPLLRVWREETEAYCREHGLPFRSDSSNPDTKRGLIRAEILPLLERLDPRARANLLALADDEPRLPRTLERSLVQLLATVDGTKAADLGRGVRAVREYDTLRLEGAVSWGPWTIESQAPGARGARPARRAIASQAGARRCRICSWTRRSHGASGMRGRSSCAATRSWPSREWRRHPGGKESCRGRSLSTSISAEGAREEGVGRILIEEDVLQARVRELGAEISRDYAGRDLLLVGVLKGAVFFMADLMRELTIPCEIDFMAISSYGAGTDSSGVVRILKDLDLNISGRNVLVVEDIIDSGLTLSYLVRSLTRAQACVGRDLRAPDQAGAARGRRPRPLHRLRDPERVRDRLRPRLRRALQESAARRRTPPRPHSPALSRHYTPRDHRSGGIG